MICAFIVNQWGVLWFFDADSLKCLLGISTAAEADCVCFKARIVCSAHSVLRPIVMALAWIGLH